MKMFIQAWNIFKHLFMLVANGIAPIKTMRLKKRSDPWMDDQILLAIRDRDNALQNTIRYIVNCVIKFNIRSGRPNNFFSRTKLNNAEILLQITGRHKKM